MNNLICFLPTNLTSMLLSIIFICVHDTSQICPWFWIPQTWHHWENWNIIKNNIYGHSTKFCISLPKWTHGLAASLFSSFTSTSFVLLYPFVMLCLYLGCNLLQASMSSVCCAKCFFRQQRRIMSLSFPICRSMLTQYSPTSQGSWQVKFVNDCEMWRYSR